MSKLPDHLIVEILSRLPVKPLIQFKCVCRSWCSIISDPQFAKLQLERSRNNTNANCNRLLVSNWSPRSIDFEAFSRGDISDSMRNVHFPATVKGPPVFYVQILGSCDGLVCLLDDYGSMFLWNPTTRDCRELPKPNGAIYAMILHGIGYNVSTDDYHIVFASHFLVNDTKEILVELYSLKMNSWRKIEHTGLVFETTGQPGIYWNGGLYWLRVKRSGPTKVYMIVSFDMLEENFKDVLYMPDQYDPNIYSASLGMSASCLCVFCECRGSCFEGLVLNVIRKEAFWSRLFSFKHDRFPGNENSVLCLTRKGEVVLHSDGWKLYLYSPKEGIFKNLEMHNDGDSCELVLYAESLVSPLFNKSYNY